jgi:hypothetical protein
MTAPIRVLELRSVWGTGGGPDKTILASAAMADRSKFGITVCYVRDARDRVYSIDKRAADLDIDYAEIVERHSYDYRIWPALRRLVRDRKIDIVHGHDQKTDVLTWALARAERVVPMSTAHGFAGRSRSERMYYAIEKRILATFPRVIAVSEPIKAELVRTGSKPDRVVVINNGIDPRVSSLVPSAASKTRSGSINSWKRSRTCGRGSRPSCSSSSAKAACVRTSSDRSSSSVWVARFD